MTTDEQSHALGKLDQVLRKHADAALSAAGIKRRDRNSPLPTDTISSEFWYRLGRPRTATGNGVLRTIVPGILQFTLLEPEDFEADSIAATKTLEESFGKKKWRIPPKSYVVTERMGTALLPKRYPNHRIMVVDGGFDFIYPVIS